MLEYEAIVEEVEELLKVAPKGYIYKTPEGEQVCRYVHRTYDDGLECGCIVGHILSRLNILTIEQMFDYDSDPDRISFGVCDLMSHHGINMPDKVRTYLVELQHYQDKGTPWSEAHARSKQYTEYIHD